MLNSDWRPEKLFKIFDFAVRVNYYYGAAAPCKLETGPEIIESNLLTRKKNINWCRVSNSWLIQLWPNLFFTSKAANTQFRDIWDLADRRIGNQFDFFFAEQFGIDAERGEQKIFAVESVWLITDVDVVVVNVEWRSRMRKTRTVIFLFSYVCGGQNGCCVSFESTWTFRLALLHLSQSTWLRQDESKKDQIVHKKIDELISSMLWLWRQISDSFFYDGKSQSSWTWISMLSRYAICSLNCELFSSDLLDSI